MKEAVTTVNPAAVLLISLVAATSLAIHEVSAQSTIPAPATVVEQLQQGILDLDKNLKNVNSASRYTAFAPLIETTHDLAYMARVTISRDWGTLDQAQQNQFIQTFRELSIASYAARFRDMDSAEFQVKNQRDMARGRVPVETELLTGDGKSVALIYVLHQTDQGWLIINVLADGVSELAIKRSQYQQILETGGFESLLLHLREQRASVATD